MATSRFIVMSPFNAVMWSVISMAGTIFLLVLGALIHAGNSMVAGGKHPIEDPKAVGRSCFYAALLYAIIFVFSYTQSYLIKKQSAEEQGFSNI